MKVTDITVTNPLYLDFVPQEVSRSWTSGPRAHSFVQVSTDEGITGICPVYPSRTVLTYLLEVYKPKIIGEDPFEVEKLWEKTYWGNNTDFRRGAGVRAYSIIDIALWDIIGKACNQPLHRLFGGYRNKANVYASAIDLNLPLDELIKLHTKFVDMGFKMVKVKIGKREIKEDINRVKALRDALGYDIDLAVDANCMYGVSTAITIANRIERYEIYFFEEPISVDDVDGSVRLAKSTSIPIAGYEVENTRFGFKELIARGAIGICQADATYSGGITEWKKIAALADCYNLPMCPHGADQVHVPLVASIPNGLFVEYMYGMGARFAELMKDPIVPKDGEMECKMQPGLGIEISEEAFRKYGSKPSTKPESRLNPRLRWAPYA